MQELRQSAALAALLFLSLVRSAIADEIATQVDIPFETFQLDNGLSVLVHSDHSTPTIFVRPRDPRCPDSRSKAPSRRETNVTGIKADSPGWTVFRMGVVGCRICWRLS